MYMHTREDLLTLANMAHMNTNETLCKYGRTCTQRKYILQRHEGEGSIPVYPSFHLQGRGRDVRSKY